MAMQKELPRYGEVAMATSYPVNQRLALPDSTISIASGDTDISMTNKTVQYMIEGRDDAKSHHQQINAEIHSCTSDDPTPSAPPASKSNTPGSKKHKHPAKHASNEHPLKRRDMSSRQCKFEIGEEWEQFQLQARHMKTTSCPPSPLAARKQSDAHAYPVDNPGYAASEPGAEIDQDLSDAADKAKEPFPFHLFFKSSSSTVKDYKVEPNPYNNLNHRFHSTLHCPCFLFFFFLCCLPGVHLMQRSDIHYKQGKREIARKAARVATVMFILGTIAGVVFLSVAIYFAADYVRQYL